MENEILSLKNLIKNNEILRDDIDSVNGQFSKRVESETEGIRNDAEQVKDQLDGYLKELGKW